MAARVVLEIIEQTQTLLTHPAIGRAGQVVGTRELVIGNLQYVIGYRVRESHVEILRVLHTSRR